MTNLIPLKQEHYDAPGLAPDDKLGLIYSPLFDGLSFDLQNELLINGKVKSFKKGETLFMDGFPVNAVYYLISGKVKEYFCNSNGDDCLRRIFIPGNYVSLHQIFMKVDEYTYSSEALNSVSCYVWRADYFIKLLQREPILAYQSARLLSDYMESSCRLNCICRKTQATSRVASYLLSKHNSRCNETRCHCHRNNTRRQVDIRPQSLSAHDICLARETFSRALSSLQENNLISLNNGIVELLNLEGLKEISGVN